MNKLKSVNQLSDVEINLDLEKLMLGSNSEFNKLILKIMTLYSKLNKDELIATLCTMEVEYQALITEMIESCATNAQNTPV